MKPATKFCVLFVTAPDLHTARQLAEGGLRNRLVACANLVPKIESHYWWKEKIETDTEVLCIFKTTKAKLPAFEKFVLAHHPYDTPEIIGLPLAVGTARYLDWITQNVADQTRKPRKGARGKR